MEYNIEFENEELVISDKAGNYRIDLKERLVDFVVNTIKFLVALSSGDLTKALHFIIDHTSKPL